MMTSKTPEKAPEKTPEKALGETKTWDDEALPEPRRYQSGWSLVVALGLIAGVLTGNQFFQGLDGAGVAILRGYFSLAGLALLAVPILAVAAGLAWRGFGRTAWVVAALAVVLVGQGVMVDEHLSRPAPIAVPSGTITDSFIITESQRHRRERQQILARFTDTSPFAPTFGEGTLRLLIPSGQPPLYAGDVITLKMQWQELLPRLMPDGFDFEHHARAQGIVASGRVLEVLAVEAGAGWSMAKMRRQFQETLFERMEPKWGAPVASALLIGLRAAIAPDLREAWRGAGLAHLLAISGLHMMLVCGVIMGLVRTCLALFPVFSSRFSPLKLAVMLALPLCLFYLFFSGVSVSALRAFLMLVLAMAAVLLSRRGITLHHVQVAAIIILLFDPASLFSAAFQMSFSAVFGLVAAWTLWQKYRRFRRVNLLMRLLGYFVAIGLSSLIASLASMPFVLHHFGVTTTWSLLANMMGMPLMGLVIMPTGGAGAVLTPLGLEALPLYIMNGGILLLSAFAEMVAGWQGARLALVPPSGLVATLLALVLISLVVMRGRWRWLSLVLAISAMALWIATPRPLAGVVLNYGKPVLAVKAADGRLVLSTKRYSGFAARILTTPFGVARGLYVRRHADSDCDSGYCLVPISDGAVAALVWDAEAVDAVCRQADLVLVMAAVSRGCQSGAMLIDRTEMLASGGMLIYADSVRGVFYTRQVNTAE